MRAVGSRHRDAVAKYSQGTSEPTRDIGKNSQKPLGMPGPQYLDNWPARQPKGDYGSWRADHKLEKGF